MHRRLSFLRERRGESVSTCIIVTAGLLNDYRSEKGRHGQVAKTSCADCPSSTTNAARVAAGVFAAQVFLPAEQNTPSGSERLCCKRIGEWRPRLPAISRIVDAGKQPGADESNAC